MVGFPFRAVSPTAAAARQTGDLCTLSLSYHCDVKGLFLESRNRNGGLGVDWRIMGRVDSMRCGLSPERLQGVKFWQG